MAQRRRVAVTGMGAITPIGNTVSEFWEGLLEGRSGIQPITEFDTEDYDCKIAGLITGFEATDTIDKKEARRMERFTHLAVAACQQAYADAGLADSGIDHDEIGCVLGVGIGGIAYIEESSLINRDLGARRINPFMITRIIPNIAPGQASIALGLKGPTMAIVTACAAGNNAIGESAEMIRRGAAKVMLAGGAESSLCPLALAGFNKMKALCPDSNDRPTEGSRPFDKTRSGFVMGEGSGVMVLEEWENAVSRGANILAEVVGYGLSSDAYHVAAPAEGGEGGIRAIRMAVRDSGLAPEQIGYINAHGTSTPLNDKYETQAIKAVFGDHAKNLVVSSTKSMVGHLLGAAGGVEGVASVLSLMHQTVHPTINLKNPDPDCDLDYVPEGARKIEGLEAVLSNSLGFGGHNAAVVFAAAKD